MFQGILPDKQKIEIEKLAEDRYQLKLTEWSTNKEAIVNVLPTIKSTGDNMIKEGRKARIENIKTGKQKDMYFVKFTL